MKVPFTLLVHLGLLRSCFAKDAKKCYYPNHAEATRDRPCDPDAEVSVCCGTPPFGSACLSNNLCKGPTGKIIRGSCTDQSWLSPGCPQFCTFWNSGGHDLVSCSNVTNRDTSYCCDEMPNCCDGGVARQEILPSNPQTWAAWVDSSSGYVVLTPLSKTTSSSTTTTSSSTTATTTTTTGSTALSSSANNSANRSETAAGATSSTPTPTAPGASTSNQQTTESTGLSTGAKAGIGAGAAGGALLIAAVAVLWWKLHKTRKMMTETPPAGTYEVQPELPTYYPQDPGVKAELPGLHDMQELEGYGRSELAGYPTYSPQAYPRTAQ